jgi:hypothetical protein
MTMARYVVIGQGIAGQPPGGYAYQLFPAGTTIADSVANAAAGDVVWPRLGAVPNAAMKPLDGEAAARVAMLGSLGWPFNVAVPN